MNSAAQFLRRSPHHRLLFIEAVLRLGWAKLVVHAVPFRWIAPGFGRVQTESPLTISPADRAVAVDVSWAVQAAARHVPLRFVCLPQAIAAQQMLRRRGIASTLYFGAALDAGKSGLLTHAWLRAGDKIVTGEDQAARHRRLAWFADGA